MSAGGVDALAVRQVIDDDQYGTRLTPLPADVLPRLARALATIPGGMDEFMVLGLNTSDDGRRRGLAIDHILTAARDAHLDWDQVLGIDLTPLEAEVVGAAITDTVDEPPTCCGHGGKCTAFAQHPESFHCVPCRAEIADQWMQAVS